VEANDAEIKRNFAERDFIRQLHVAKNYLSELILKSLRLFQSEYQADYRIKNLLIESDILIRKDLGQLAEIRLRKAKQLAKLYEKDHLLLEIISKQRRQFLATAGSVQAQQGVNQLIEEEKNCIERLKQLNDYWDMSINLYDRLNVSSPDSQLENQIDFETEDQIQTVQAKSLYYYVRQSYSYFEGKPEKGLDYVDRMIALWEENPQRIQEDPSSYITALNNRIVIAMRNGWHDQIAPILEKIRRVPQDYGLRKPSVFTVKTMLQSYNIELELYRDLNEWQKGIDLISEIELIIRNHQKIIPDDYRILFNFQFAYLFYRINNHEKALPYLNDLLRFSGSEYRSDIQSYGHLLNLMIHYEMGHYVMLKYAVDACRRFFRKRQLMQHFERQLLRFFSRISLNSDKKMIYLADLRENIFTGMNEKEIGNVIDYIDFYSFIDRHNAEN
ncbi:MAG: hypothetical protein KDD94_05915, partial [Calditrichaeota bacterium]|nr:hypothetical protein [Calditrichota bacterium]